MRDNYYQIDVVWKDGFKHKINCRGYNLKSMLDFQASIFWIESYKYKEITEQQYNKAQAYDSYTTEKESSSSRKQSGTNNGKRNNSGRNDKQPRLKAGNSTSSRTTGNAGKSR